MLNKQLNKPKSEKDKEDEQALILAATLIASTVLIMTS